MRDVHVTDLRNHLLSYLAEVQKGEHLRVMSRGKVIARIVPEVDAAVAAQQRLSVARDKTKLGDLLSPIDISWDAER